MVAGFVGLSLSELSTDFVDNWGCYTLRAECKSVDRKTRVFLVVNGH